MLDPAKTPADCPQRDAGLPRLGIGFAPPGEPLLRLLGTLRDPDDAYPTVAELHEDGPRYEAPRAPIAPAWFPFHRCEVWA